MSISEVEMLMNTNAAVILAPTARAQPHLVWVAETHEAFEIHFLCRPPGRSWDWEKT